MDTNMTIVERAEIHVDEVEETLPHPVPGPGPDHLSAFRPDAEERLAPESLRQQPVQKGHRGRLMITASGLAVLAIAGGVFWISPYNHYSVAGAGRLATQARDVALNSLQGASRTPPPIAPAAQLARAPEPTRAPTPYRVPAPTKSATAGGDDMAEFLRLGGQTPPPVPSAPPPTPPLEPVVATPTAVALAPLAPASVPATLGPVPKPVKVSPSATPQPEAASAKPAAPPLPAPEHPVVVATPSDPVAKVAALQAAPLTDAQQLQVLELVTQLGVLVRDQRVAIAELRSDQQNLVQRVDGSLADFGRRVSLAEAHRAVNAAMETEMHAIQAPAAPVAGPTGNGGVVQIAVRAGGPAPGPAADTVNHRYHVQAASPGLAMLSELDPSGGEERELPVSPGDDVPGWGKVIGIAQRGVTWVVNTDHGLIQ
jgi:hypothetical protein